MGSGVARAWRGAVGQRVTHQWRHGLASQAVQAEREWRCRASGAGVDAAASSVMNQSRAAAAPVESVARDAHGKLGGAEGGTRTPRLLHWVVIVGGDTSYMLIERELAITKVVSPAAIR